MLIKKSGAKRIDNSQQCTVWEYEYSSDNFSLATALINGRYPDEGKSSNEKCEQIYYAISGNGVIHSDKGNFEISAGDLYYFEIGEIYYVEGDNLLIALINSPKWTSDQYKHVD
ncbi:MAG: hypothetical protein ABIG10_03040 [bacterium]